MLMAEIKVEVIDQGVFNVVIDDATYPTVSYKVVAEDEQEAVEIAKQAHLQ